MCGKECVCNMYCLSFMWVNVCGKGVCSVEPVTLHFHMSEKPISVTVCI